MSWLTKPIDDVCEVEYGTRVVNKRDGGSIYSVYGGGGATFHMDEFNRENRMVVARFAMSEQCTRFVRGKFFLNDSGLTLSPKKQMPIAQDFLDWQMLFLNDQIYSLAKGSAQKNLDVPAFRKMEISFPESLAEQKRIVKTLDKVFGEVKRVKEVAEKNLQNSKELFESYLQSVFASPGKDWEKKSLEEISTKITDGVHKKPTYVPYGIPFIKINNLTEGSNISFKDVSYITAEDHKEFCKRTKPEKGDILITKDGTIGIVRIIETDIEFSIFVSVALIKPISKDISSYLRYVLMSPMIQNQIKPKGAALKHLYLKDLRKFTIPLAPSREQKTIVKKLDALLLETKKLEKIYEQKLTDLEELKKSVLKKAFSR